jgi:hypothetical protein
MFLVPPVASIILFVLLWWTNRLARPVRTGICVVGGMLVQFLAPTFSLVWVAGLLANVSMAVYLTIRLKLAW